MTAPEMTSPEMTEAMFRARLAEKALLLDERAIVEALAGARHLRADVARLRALMEPEA